MSHTRRKAYTKAKAVDKSCRNGGSCPYCKGNRLYKNLKKTDKNESYITINYATSRAEHS